MIAIAELPNCGIVELFFNSAIPHFRNSAMDSQNYA
jgi:hypothetical protein